jgi:hypothetical protein
MIDYYEYTHKFNINIHRDQSDRLEYTVTLDQPISIKFPDSSFYIGATDIKISYDLKSRGFEILIKQPLSSKYYCLGYRLKEIVGIDIKEFERFLTQCIVNEMAKELLKK